MTSTTSYNESTELLSIAKKVKNQGSKIFLWTIKNKIATIVTYFSLLFLILPLSSLLIVFITQSSGINYSYYETAGSMIFNIAVQSIVIMFSIIFSFGAFSYLHKKRQVDLFGAFPVNRRTMFFSRYFAALAMILVPAFAAIVLGSLPYIAMGAFSTFTMFLGNYCFLTLTVIANVSFIALISVCCGNASDGVISYLLISALYPIGYTLFSIFPSIVIPGLSGGISFNAVLLVLLSPGISGYVKFGLQNTGLNMNYSNIFQFDLIALTIYLVIFSAICLGLCFLFAKKRKAESAQSAWAFKIPQYIITILVCAVSAIVAGFITMAALSSGPSINNVFVQYIWFWLFAAFAGAVAVLLVQILFMRGFKEFWKNAIAYGATMVFCLILFVSCVLGFFGTDHYVPNTDSITKVSIRDSDYGEYYFWTENKEIIQSTVEIHEQITNEMNLTRTRPYSLYNGYNLSIDYGSSDYYRSITIEYQLKNGSTIKRYYYNSSGDFAVKSDGSALQLFDDLLDSKAYKTEKVSYYFDFEANYLDLNYLDIWLPDNGGTTNCEYTINDLDKKELEELLKALKEDVFNDDNPLYNGNYSYTDYSLNFYFDSDLNNNYYEYYSNNSKQITVKPEYEKTLAQMEKMGLTNEVYLQQCNSKSNIMRDYKYKESEDEFVFNDDYKEITFEAPENWEGENVYCRMIFSGGLYFTDINEKMETKDGKIYTYKVPLIRNAYDNSLVFSNIMFYSVKDNDYKNAEYTKTLYFDENGNSTEYSATGEKNTESPYHLYNFK